MNKWALCDLGPAPSLDSLLGTFPLSHSGHTSLCSFSNAQKCSCLRTFALALPSAWKVIPLVISHGSYPHLLQVSVYKCHQLTTYLNQQLAPPPGISSPPLNLFALFPP